MKSSFWQHFPDVDDNDPLGLTDSLASYQKLYAFDFIKTCPAGTWLASCYGAVSEKIEDDLLGRRRVSEPIINEPNQWHLLPHFSESVPKPLSDQIETIKALKQRNQSAEPILATVFCPFSQAMQLAGEVTVLDHAKNYPTNLQSGINTLLENTMYSIEKLLEAGASGIYLVSQHLDSKASTLSAYDIFGHAADLACLGAVSDDSFNLFHIHGAPTRLPELPTDKPWYLHGNQLRLTARPLLKSVLCFSPDEMLEIKSELQIQNLIQMRFNPDWHVPIITPTCVLPLNFPEEHLLRWRSAAKTLITDDA